MKAIDKKIATPYLESIIMTCEGQDLKMIVSGQLKTLDSKKVKVFLDRVKQFDRSIFKTLNTWLGIYSLTE